MKEEYEKCKSRAYEGSPFTQEGVTEDPFKTIVVSKLNFETTDERLKQEFSIYGNVKAVLGTTYLGANYQEPRRKVYGIRVR